MNAHSLSFTAERHEEDGCRELWGSVLNLAIQDALRIKPTRHQGSGATSMLDQYQARRWLGSSDFRLICSLAGIEPEFVVDRVTPLIAAPAEVRRDFLERLNPMSSRCARTGPRAAPQPAGEPKQCRHCGKAIAPDNRSGMCQQHNHWQGCGCKQCKRRMA